MKKPEASSEKAGAGEERTKTEAPAQDEATALREKLNVAELAAYVEKEGRRAQPMARRLLKAAEEAGEEGKRVGHTKPEGGGRSVAIGDSAQKLRKEPRAAALKGYTGLDIAGSHLAMANALTGRKFKALDELCGNYEETLRQLARKTGTDRTGAKAFYLSILNGGGVTGWRRGHGVPEGAPLTEHAWRYVRQVKALRAGIIQSTPTTAEAAEARGKSPITLARGGAELSSPPKGLDVEGDVFRDRQEG